jgi:hypothetical protein
MTTTATADAFEKFMDKFGPTAVAGALGFMGCRHEDPEVDEHLWHAFANLNETDQAQALLVLAMALGSAR